MKRGTPAHPKTIDLSERLDIPVYAAVGLLEMLWHYVGDYTPQGNVGKVSDRVIARAVQWDKDPSLLIDALVGAHWLDRSEQHRLIVHDWNQHAEELVRKRLSRIDGGLEFLSEYSNTSLRKGVADNGGQCPTMAGSRGARLGPDVATAMAEAFVEDGGLGEETIPAEPSEQEQPSEAAGPKSVSGLWKRLILGNLKQSERKLIEQRATELLMTFEEWEIRITAYRDAPWAVEKKHPVQVFLKDPRRWEPQSQRRAYETPIAAVLRNELTLRRVEPGQAVAISMPDEPETVEEWLQWCPDRQYAGFGGLWFATGAELSVQMLRNGRQRWGGYDQTRRDRICQHASRKFPKTKAEYMKGSILRYFDTEPWGFSKIDRMLPAADTVAKATDDPDFDRDVAAMLDKTRTKQEKYGIQRTS